jgi:nicotinamide-nucleotide amidase
MNGRDESALEKTMEEGTEWVLKKMGERVISSSGASMEEEVGSLLNQKKATVAVAESCTGGLVSHMLTNVPGSSDYFLFSGVTYSNQAKIDVLGVSSDTLKEFGAVHEETAKEMADRVRRISGATYGLSTSGIAGPGGGTPEKPVGTLCVGLATPFAVEGHRFEFPFKRRSRNKQIFAMTALDLLRRELMNDDS